MIVSLKIIIFDLFVFNLILFSSVHSDIVFRYVRDFIFSEDVAYWILEAVENAPAGLPLNLGNGQGVTIKEVAETIARIVNATPKIQWDVSKPAGDPCRTLAMDRAIEVIGYHTQTTLEEGIRKTVEWYCDQQ